jgi:hypothetical protein
MSAFNLVANAHATRAENAAVVVKDVTLVGSIDAEARMPVGHRDVRDTELLGEGLQFAVSVGDTDGADVVTLAEEHLDDDTAIVFQALCVDENFHAFLNLGHAGRQELVVALDFYEANAAGADFGETVDVAEGRDIDSVFLRDFKNGLVFACADILAIYLQGFNL